LEEIIKNRTKQIGLNIIKLIDELPANQSSWVISKQLIRCSTSIGANYRAACRAKSDLDFINKLKIVEEEADETIYWLELLEESGLTHTSKIKHVKQETTEILSIIVASINTMKRKTQNHNS